MTDLALGIIAWTLIVGPPLAHWAITGRWRWWR
jgi:hypothetical protein